MALKLCLVAELRVPDGRIIRSLQISSMAKLQIKQPKHAEEIKHKSELRQKRQ